MRTPVIRYADHLQNWEDEVETTEGWVLCRPLSYDGICLLWRLKCAWWVFTGKMDVLAWKGNQ